MIGLCFILAALVSPWPIGAAAAGTATSNELHRSHMFHVKPHALIHSVLSDVRRRPLVQNAEGSSVLDIDVSSSRLDDSAAVSFLEELLPMLKLKVGEADDSQSETRVPLLIKLALAMNKLTPSGASNVFDLLVNKDEAEDDGGVLKENTNNGTIPVEDRAVDTDNTDGMEIESDSIVLNETNAVRTANDAISNATIPDTEEQAILIEELDLSFNAIGDPNVQLMDSVRRLFEGGGVFVPRIISLENCGVGPAFCRSIGRGILNAFERKNNGEQNISYRPSVLRIGGNDAIGDAGTVALAAALRMAIENDSDSHQVLEELDLSSCNVGDVGAEALALALASNPGCLSRLDLSNNKITDAGSKALGRALVDAAAATSCTICEQIVLDNNSIGDDGAAALAEALACGAVRSISMRSCSIRGQGTAAFGKAVVSLANRKQNDESSHFHIDLSGNHFGTQKIKKKKGLSASAIRDKASTNIKFIGKTLKGAAKRFSSDAMGITADSDDDEEVMGGLIDEDAEELDGDKIQACGGHSFAGEVLRDDSQKKDGSSPVKIYVSMRQCMLGASAIDALSASVCGAKNCKMSVDVSMNSSVDEEVADALMNGVKDSKILASKAERHLDFLDRIADARQRQKEAAETAAARVGSYLDDEDDFDDLGFDYDPYDDLN